LKVGNDLCVGLFYRAPAGDVVGVGGGLDHHAGVGRRVVVVGHAIEPDQVEKGEGAETTVFAFCMRELQLLIGGKGGGGAIGSEGADAFQHGVDADDQLVGGAPHAFAEAADSKSAVGIAIAVALCDRLDQLVHGYVVAAKLREVVQDLFIGPVDRAGAAQHIG